jgi:MurNAc alpha-1-phosphate uridylyltransferase
MLLAAGRGERMRPLTDHTAKPLLCVNDKPLIVYHLEKLASAGITEIVINTSWQAEKINQALGNGSAFGLHIEYSHEPTALETAGGIRQALHLLGEHPFFLISADIWCDVDYTDLLSNTGTSAAHLLMVSNPPHHPDGDFCIDCGNALRLQAENDPSDKSCTYSGIGLFHPSLFEGLPVAPCALREVLIPAIRAGSVSATYHDGLWFDVGTVERLQALDKMLRNE